MGRGRPKSQKTIERELLALEEEELLLEKDILKGREVIEAYYATHELERWKPYWYQAKVDDYFDSGKRIVVVPLSNKIGKTRGAAATIHSWALGYQPWNKVKEDFPGAVKVGDQYFAPSSLGKKPPVKIRVAGEDWEEHIKRTIIPELEFFEVPGEWKKSKNNLGVDYIWRHRNGSELLVMSYGQDEKNKEAFMADAAWLDEPCAEAMWATMSRALFLAGGKILLTMTPLRQPWVQNQLIKSGRLDVGVVQDVDLWGCPHLYDHDLAILRMCGLTEDQARAWMVIEKQEAWKTKYLPDSQLALSELLGTKTVTFRDEWGREITSDALTYAIQNLKILRFILDLKSDSERLPRVFGKPRHLMGLCWPKWNPDVMKVEPFKIPTDWPVTFQWDFHPNEKMAISFFTVDPWGRKFVIDEVWEHLTNRQGCDEIIRRKKTFGWRLNRGEIDALAKGDSSYVRNRFGVTEDSFYEIQRMLGKEGISLGVGSKAEENYIAKVDEWMGHTPCLFYVFDTCKETISQIEDWVRDEKTGKPSDKGHFPENIGRFSQMGFRYTDPSLETMPLEPKYQECPI